MMRKIAVAMGVVLCLALAAQGASVVDFEAVGLRPANDGSGFGTVEEFATQDGARFNIPKAGQKAVYGTKAVNGLSINNVQYIEFTWLDGPAKKSPYTNMVITDGAGSYGVISSQGGVMQSEVETFDEQGDLVAYEQRRRFYFAGDNGNQSYGFRFYEPSGSAPWIHGTNLDFSDISGWSLLGVGQQRPLSDDEGTQARGPVDQGLAIMWGDSQSNYLGWREISDVEISMTDGTTLVAGAVPEPLTMLAVGSAVAGLGGYIRRRRRG